MKNATLIRFLLLATLWGSSFTFIKVSLEGLTPAQLVLARLILGAAILLVIIAFRRIALPKGAAVWGHLALAALFGNVIPFLLLSYGEKSTGAGIAGVLIGSTPLLTLMLAAMVIPEERATSRKLLGLVGGFVGVVLVIGPWRDAFGSITGQLCCFGAAVSYAAGFVYVRRFLSPKKLPPLALAASQLISAAALQAVATPVFVWQTPHWSNRVIGAMLILGALNTGWAYVLYFRIIGDTSATTASAVNYVVPVTAVAIGVVLLGEGITWNLIVGGLVVLVSMAYAENRLAQLRKAKEPAAPPPAERAAGTKPSLQPAAEDGS